MAVEFYVKVAAKIASFVHVFNGSNPPKLKVTPQSSSLSSSAVPVLCPSSLPYRNLNALSLLYEACGRTVNPVNGAVGLLWTGNWSICQAAVETVLRGGSLRPLPELLNGNGFSGFPSPSEICTEMLNPRQGDSGDQNMYHHCRFSSSRSRSTASPPKRKRFASEQPSSELDLSLIPTFPIKTAPFKEETPSMYSEESVTTVSFRDNTAGDLRGGKTAKLLNLFA